MLFGFGMSMGNFINVFNYRTWLTTEDGQTLTDDDGKPLYTS